MAPRGIKILTPVSMELNTPPLLLNTPLAVAARMCPSSSFSSLNAEGLTGMALGTALTLFGWYLGLSNLYTEHIHSTVELRRLQWAVCFQNWLTRIGRFWWQLWLTLSCVCQEIMFGFRTFKLVLKGPCSITVRFYCKAVVRRSDCFLNLSVPLTGPLSGKLFWG